MVINTGMVKESDCVAQVLREVHIVLCEEGRVSQIPFILTNTFVWGFGIAERKDGWIKVTTVSNEFVDDNDYSSLVAHIADTIREQQKQLSPFQ